MPQWHRPLSHRVYESVSQSHVRGTTSGRSVSKHMSAAILWIQLEDRYI